MAEGLLRLCGAGVEHAAHTLKPSGSGNYGLELELELIQPHMAQKPVLRGEAGYFYPVPPYKLWFVG